MSNKFKETAPQQREQPQEPKSTININPDEPFVNGGQAYE
jgi:hypothetical protein